jgi:hypothetical protein
MLPMGWMVSTPGGELQHNAQQHEDQQQGSHYHNAETC